LHARIESLSQQVIILERKITAMLTNSTNSSKPPSSDGPKDPSINNLYQKYFMCQ